MLRWEGAVLAVLIPFAMPSPNIGSPRIIPRIGPGNSITAKFILAKAIRPDIAKVCHLQPAILLPDMISGSTTQQTLLLPALSRLCQVLVRVLVLLSATVPGRLLH